MSKRYNTPHRDRIIKTRVTEEEHADFMERLTACNKIIRMPIIDIFKGALPYIICNIIVLIAISLWPALTTWLPALLGY